MPEPETTHDAQFYNEQRLTLVLDFLKGARIVPAR